MEGDTLPLEDGSLLSLKDKIGAGSFSTVRRAVWSFNQKSVAVKLEPRSQASHFLSKEARVLATLQGQSGIPKLFGIGNNDDWSYIAMELLGNSLSHKFKKCDKRFSVKTVLQLADQMLVMLEELMQVQCVHRDIKPSNFLVGLDRDVGKLYLVDFGLARKWQHYFGTGGGGGGVIGTVPFMSLAAHTNCNYGFKDDLESTLYVLIYFFHGALPWEGKKLPLCEVKRLKSHITAEELCAGLPHEFQLLLNYARSLTSEACPNYPEIRNRLREAANRLELSYNWVYDWSRKVEEPEKRRRKSSCRITDSPASAPSQLTRDCTLLHPFAPCRPSLPVSISTSPPNNCLLSYLDLHQSEVPAALTDGKHQPVPEHFLGRILRQVELVEAGVGCRQSFRPCVAFVDLEALNSGVASESSEPFQRHFAASGYKLQQ